MPQRRSLERFEENAAALRALVDAGSPRIVRDAVEGSRIAGTRRKFPLPSIGHRSGKLAVTGYLRGKRGVSALIVACDCGRPEFTIEHNNFRTFKSTRCSPCGHTAGSEKRYWQYAAALPDDTHRTRLLNRLSAAITRCHNSSAARYSSYGGRGIYVHTAWRDDKAEFLRYVQTLPGWDDPSREMDRIDNDRGYLPGNIRFATRSQNMGNRRQVDVLSANVQDLEARIRELEARLSGV
jgi:hypothetical protein